MSLKFTGFPRETFSFLQDLSANNNKDWFEENRSYYEENWRAPSLRLINALSEPLGLIDPSLKAEARINGSLRRINRDVRFSKNKTPYDPRIHLIFWSGSHPNRSPAFHLVLRSNGFGYGAGVFGIGSEALKQYRDRIMRPKERTALLSAVGQAENHGCSFDEPELKRLPAGYDTDENWAHLLRRKSFVLRTMEEPPIPDWIYNHSCVPEILKITKAVMPFIRWLNS